MSAQGYSVDAACTRVETPDAITYQWREESEYLAALDADAERWTVPVPVPTVVVDRLPATTCPTCKRPGSRTIREAIKGYQCLACTRHEEEGF